MTSSSVFGIYENQAAVERAVTMLKERGFQATDISVLWPQDVDSKDVGHDHEVSSKAPEGASAGAGTGAVIGGTLGWLVGIGALAIPGIGPLIAAGPIVAALAGAGAVGAVGGLTGALVGYGIPEYEAKRYEGRVRKGNVLLSVHAADREWAARAREILEATGADDISSSGEAKSDVAGTRSHGVGTF